MSDFKPPNIEEIDIISLTIPLSKLKKNLKPFPDYSENMYTQLKTKSTSKLYPQEWHKLEQSVMESTSPPGQRLMSNLVSKLTLYIFFCANSVERFICA